MFSSVRGFVMGHPSFRAWFMFARRLYYLYRLRRNLRQKPLTLRQIQLKMLRAVIKHVYENVPYYHRKFRAAGVKPDDVKGVDDLCKIPITSKFEVQSCDVEDVVSSGFDVKRLVRRTTSGSTGIPLATFIDRRFLDFEEAVWMRAWFEDGLRIRDRMAVIADPRTFPKGKTFFRSWWLAERCHISIFDSVERQMELLSEFRPDVVKGYASSLYLLAVEASDLKAKVKPRLVFSGAGLLDEHSRKKINTAFGAEVFDFYACSELGLIGWECKAHSGFHVNADSVLIEFLDEDGTAVAPGEGGRVVGTSLFNYVMPLIRYDLGDVAVPIDDECPCGVTLPLIRLVEGRGDDFLVATDGRLIPPTVFFPYPFENMDKIKQFRVIQKRRDKLRIELVPKEEFLDENGFFEKAEKRIKQLFGEHMQVEFKVLDEIPLDKTGKLRKVISLNSKKGYGQELKREQS